jgi:hypothetical protein
MASRQDRNKAGNEAAAKVGADSAAKIADRVAREQGKNQKDASITETTKTGATVHTTVQQNQESEAYCPRVDETTPQEFETKVQVIRKVPEMKTVEKTEMVKRLSHEEKTTTVPRTKVVTEERTSTTKHPVVKEVQKTRTIDVHRVVEEEKEITETVDVVEQVRERKVEKIPKVIYEEKETWITKPVVRQVEKKRTIKVPRVITEKKEEAYTDYVTEDVEEKKVEKVPRVVTEHVKQTMSVPVVTEVPVTKKVEVPTGGYCEEVVSHDHAPAPLGPTVVPEKVTSVSDTKIRSLEKEAEASTEEPRRGLLGRLIGA